MKVPCMYTFKSAAYVCEKQATRSQLNTSSAPSVQRLSYSQCPNKSQLFGNSCLWQVNLPKKYIIDKDCNTNQNIITERVNHILREGEMLCQKQNATFQSSINGKMLSDFFHVWRHQVKSGGRGVLVKTCSSTEQGCMAKLVRYEFDHPSVAQHMLRRFV